MARERKLKPGFQAAGFDRGVSVDGASGDVSLVTMSAFVRRNEIDRPYAVVNDAIGSTLGVRLGLPVPPGWLIALSRTEVGWCSVGFGDSRHTPPPADMKSLAQRDPWVATGVVVLDWWLANDDRHEENLVDLPRFGVSVIDHDASLIGHGVYTDHAAAASHLDEMKGTPARPHEFAPHLLTAQHFDEWLAKVARLSRAEIRRVVRPCFDANLVDARLRDALVDFLTARANLLRDYVHRRSEDFARISDWPLGNDYPLESGGEGHGK